MQTPEPSNQQKTRILGDDSATVRERAGVGKEEGKRFPRLSRRRAAASSAPKAPGHRVSAVFWALGQVPGTQQ